MSVSTPDVTVTVAPYKEGTMVYERKYPGEPSMGGDITMDRGVARGDSSFWYWMRTVIEGSGEYRADFDILHFHREQGLTQTVGPHPEGNKTNLELANPARRYHVYNAFPTAHNVVTNALTATDGEISIMSITVAYEHFEVEEVTAV
jgi:phage tail-like protein